MNHSELREGVLIRLAETINDNLRPLCLIGLGAAAGVLIASWSVPSPGILLGWLGGMLLVYGGLFALVMMPARVQLGSAHPERTLLGLAALNALAGLAWGGLALGMAWLGEVEHAALVLLVVAGLAVSKLALCQGHLPVVIGFVLTGLVPPAVLLATQEAELARPLAIATLAAAVFIMANAVPLRRHLLQRLEDAETIEEQRRLLEERAEQVETLTVGLRGLKEKHGAAEQDLRRLSADLGLAEGKARALADTLQRVSLVCPQTGLANARSFENTLAVEFRRAMRSGQPLALLLVDIDLFDQYTRQYGSQLVDGLLKRLAKGLGTYGRRAGDLAARLDSARFALLLPNCPGRSAERIAETFRKRVEALKVAHAASPHAGVVTVRVGVAALVPMRGSSEQDLVKRAEAASYEAGFNDGNRVVLYRTLDALKLEHWSAAADGPFDADTLEQKLLIRGYDPRRTVIDSGRPHADHAYERETAVAPISGELRVDVEGQSVNLRIGDTLYLPAGVTHSLEAAGERPCLIFEAPAAGG
jgi:diguanylate cyclase (GGDEF)-like protein